MNLKCGNQKDGYRHIKKNHFHEWKGLADIEGISWMDVADMAITKSLTHASFWKNSTERGSTCYSGTIYLVDRVRGIPVKEVYPSVIAGNVSNKIVTAFPGAKCLRH
ncbi:hypothetical protein [Corynebacterium vitaeruminis]|uniref:hypothetical protein n=1 Tax=Corynebacterium vitaeruminis TaxID=38305 RepID=UPI0028B15F1A|nr:hypothetical protein [Corynebacterium vitaeruminis]